MWWQRNIDQYWTDIAYNKLYDFLYVVAAFLAPEVLAIVLFIVPWVRNYIENSSWRIFHLLTWWFQVKYFQLFVESSGSMSNLPSMKCPFP